MTTIKAPAVIKLFGEHAVVYGKLAIAAAVDLYASASFLGTEAGSLEIRLLDLDGASAEFNERTLRLLYKQYELKESIASYVEKSNLIDKRILPYATIAARLLVKFGAFASGIISITSEIPPQSGLASSAACSTAFATLLLKASNRKISDDEVIDVARDGERISHLSEGAGRIDVSASYHGGYIGFSSASGVTLETAAVAPSFLIVNTGPKKPTAETVGHIAKQYNEERDKTEALLDKINECSLKGRDALKNGDLGAVGKIMLEDQRLLAVLGVSSSGLDRAVEIAERDGALGAKLSGGGGGGIAIVLIDKPNVKLNEDFAEEGFTIVEAQISKTGAKDFLLDAAP